MAITTEITPSTAVLRERRSQRIQIEAPRGGVPCVQAFRQISDLDADGKIVTTKEFVGPVQRMVTDDILAQSITVAGKSYTAAEIMAAIAAFVDQWETEDLAPPPTPPPES